MLTLAGLVAGLTAPAVRQPAVPPASHSTPVLDWVNPLEVDGFCEPGGWGFHADPTKLPLLVFLPGMDGSLFTPFMQYPELGSKFELACMCHVDGLSSRASFDELVENCAHFVASHTSSGRRVMMVGESFGATLALGVLNRLGPDNQPAGAVLVNPATSYQRSILSTLGPAATALPQPFYSLSLLVLAALVLEPAQFPSFVTLILALRQPALLATPAREAFLGRVLLSALLGIASGPQFMIGPLLKPSIFRSADLAFRLSSWLDAGATKVEDTLPMIGTPLLVIAGERDRLLPSVEEAERLFSRVPKTMRKGIVVVPCAGHASTLGTQLDLAAEIERAFAFELGLPRAEDKNLEMSQAVCSPTGAPTQQSKIEARWANGLIPRQYEPLSVSQYREWNRQGKHCPLPGLAAKES